MYVRASGRTPWRAMPRRSSKARSSSSGASVLVAGASQAFSARLKVTASGCTPAQRAHSQPLCLAAPGSCQNLTHAVRGCAASFALAKHEVSSTQDSGRLLQRGPQLCVILLRRSAGRNGYFQASACFNAPHDRPLSYRQGHFRVNTDSVSPRAWDSLKRARARSLYWHSRQAVRRALQLSVLGVTPCCCMRFHNPMALSTCFACAAACRLTDRMLVCHSCGSPVNVVDPKRYLHMKPPHRPCPNPIDQQHSSQECMHRHASESSNMPQSRRHSMPKSMQC